MNSHILAVAFDAYGTLCYIADPTQPFSELLRQTNIAAPEAKRLCMTHNGGLVELVQSMAPSLASDLAALEEKVQREVASVRLFPEVEETLDRLRARGMRLGLVSNLALPYAEPVQKLLGDRIDVYIWSLEVGAVKPELAIFEALYQRLSACPEQVLMVGDSRRADVEGARGAGMQALHLVRETHAERGDSITTLTDVLEWLDAP